MSHFHNSFCVKCRKPFDHDHHHDDCHHDRFDVRDRFIGDDRFLCDNRFQLRLGGLQSGLAFRMRQLIDCEVRIKVDCGGESDEFGAVICFVGSDFVEVEVFEDRDKDRDRDKNRVRDKDRDRDRGKKPRKKRHYGHKFRIIPLEHVKMVEFKEDKHDCC